MAKELTELEKHYNKFNEEKRLGRRHGQEREPDGILWLWQKKAMMSQQWNW